MIRLDSYGQGRASGVTLLSLHDVVFLVKCYVMAKSHTLDVGHEGEYELEAIKTCIQ